MDFYTSWNFLNNHKMFNDHFMTELWLEVVKVNPENNVVDDDNTKNTKVRIWLEHGPFDRIHGTTAHDIDLDCGGDTFEEAIINLAELVQKYYNNDGVRIDAVETMKRVKELSMCM